MTMAQSIDIHTFESASLVYDPVAEFPDWVNTLREQCHERYLTSDGFSRKDEQWQYFDPEQVVKQSLNRQFSEESSDVLVDGCPAIELTDESVVSTDVVDGVEVLDFDDLTSEQLDMLMPHWTGLLNDPNLFNVLHFSQLRHVLFVNVTGDTTDIQQVIVKMTNALKGVEHVKLVVFVESGAKGTLLLEALGDAHVSAVSHVSIDVFCASDSDLKMVWSHTSAESMTRMTTLKAVVDDRATFKLTYLNRYLPVLRHEVSVDIIGRDADVQLRGLSLLSGDQTMCQSARIHHHQENCVSYQLFKHILIDQAESSFTGLVYVEPEAQKTDAYQTNNNLLLSDKARSISRPQLEIFADDVKCSHGSITGQIDSELLFYLMSRGVSRAMALSILLGGFVDEVLDLIDIPNIAALYRSDIQSVLDRIGKEIT